LRCLRTWTSFALGRTRLPFAPHCTARDLFAPHVVPHYWFTVAGLWFTGSPFYLLCTASFAVATCTAASFSLRIHSCARRTVRLYHRTPRTRARNAFYALRITCAPYLLPARYYLRVGYRLVHAPLPGSACAHRLDTPAHILRVFIVPADLGLLTFVFFARLPHVYHRSAGFAFATHRFARRGSRINKGFVFTTCRFAVRITRAYSFGSCAARCCVHCTPVAYCLRTLHLTCAVRYLVHRLRARSRFRRLYSCVTHSRCAGCGYPAATCACRCAHAAAGSHTAVARTRTTLSTPFARLCLGWFAMAPLFAPRFAVYVALHWLHTTAAAPARITAQPPLTRTGFVSFGSAAHTRRFARHTAATPAALRAHASRIYYRTAFSTLFRGLLRTVCAGCRRSLYHGFYAPRYGCPDYPFAPSYRDVCAPPPRTHITRTRASRLRVHLSVYRAGRTRAVYCGSGSYYRVPLPAILWLRSAVPHSLHTSTHVAPFPRTARVLRRAVLRRHLHSPRLLGYVSDHTTRSAVARTFCACGCAGLRFVGSFCTRLAAWVHCLGSPHGDAPHTTARLDAPLRSRCGFSFTTAFAPRTWLRFAVIFFPVHFLYRVARAAPHRITRTPFLRRVYSTLLDGYHRWLPRRYTAHARITHYHRLRLRFGCALRCVLALPAGLHRAHAHLFALAQHCCTYLSRLRRRLPFTHTFAGAALHRRAAHAPCTPFGLHWRRLHWFASLAARWVLPFRRRAVCGSAHWVYCYRSFAAPRCLRLRTSVYCVAARGCTHWFMPALDIVCARAPLTLHSFPRSRGCASFTGRFVLHSLVTLRTPRLRFCSADYAFSGSSPHPVLHHFIVYGYRFTSWVTTTRTPRFPTVCAPASFHSLLPRS